MDKYDITVNDISFSIFKDNGAWGDGNHESTKFVMDFIYKYGVKDKSVIDVGTGTGILSVLCALLGASSILAIDIDTHSLEWARKNFKRNNVNVEVEVNNLTEHLDDKADVVLANLPGQVQVENMKDITKNLNKGGLLIISWWNKLKFENYVKGFEVVDYSKGNDYDAYVLKVKE